MKGSNMNYVLAGSTIANEYAVKVRTKGFHVPEAKGKLELYVISVKKDSPVTYFTLGGICFNKGVMPKAAAYVENDGKMFFPSLVLMQLAKNQADALIEEAKKRPVQIPQKFNEAFYADRNQPQYHKAYEITLYNCMICELKEDFEARQQEEFEIDHEDQVEEQPASREVISKELYANQAKRGKK